MEENEERTRERKVIEQIEGKSKIVEIGESKERNSDDEMMSEGII